MKFGVQKIVKEIQLGDYAPEYAGQTVLVWVNVPREMQEQRRALLEKYAKFLKASRGPLFRWYYGYVFKKIENESQDWFSRLWSAGADEATHWPKEEVRALNRADAVLYKWLTRKSIELVDAFAQDKKK